MIGGNVTEKITPETYEKMNKEFEEEGLAFTIEVPTQEEINAWKDEPHRYFDPPPGRDLVQEMWDAVGGRPND